MKKKILSLLLAVVMLISVMPMSAMTASAATNWSGSVGYHDLDNNHTIAKGTSIKANSSKVSGPMYVYLDGTCVRNVSYNNTYTTDRCTKVSSWENKSNNMYLYLVTNCPSFTSRTCTQSQHCTTCGWVKNAAYGHDYSVYQSVNTSATCTTNRIDNYKCSRCSSTTTKTITNTALGHEYTKQGTLVSKATCTAKAVYNKQCTRCTATRGTMEVGSALGHSYTKQGSKVSDATIDSPAIYNKQCERCTATSGTMQVGDKLPSMKVSYTDPLTGEEINLGSATNDNAKELIGSIMKRPMQKQNNLFLGWYDDKNKAINKNATRFDMLTNITADYAGIGYMDKDYNDDKMIPAYKTFGLAGVQIREDRTQEHFEEGEDKLEGEVYGGLRYVASFSEQLKSIVENNANVEYGFVMASRANAEMFARKYGVAYDKYEIKYNLEQDGETVARTADTDFRYVTNVVCSNNIDHRNFDGYRLFTAVIDYENAESLKDTEFVARAYVKYVDANGNTQIYYDDYDGTTTFGGCSVSYNQALAMSM